MSRERRGLRIGEDAPKRKKERESVYFVPNFAMTVFAAAIYFPFNWNLSAAADFVKLVPFALVGTFFGSSAWIRLSDGEFRRAERSANVAKVLFCLNLLYFLALIATGRFPVSFFL